MPTVSGLVSYSANNLAAPGVGIASVPVVLYSPSTLTGAVALTDANGLFTFNNVPNGAYQVIEAWGATGGTLTPVDFATAAVPMPVAPAEAEPPLSALPVAPPAGADRLMALSPNLLNVTVAGGNVTGLNFIDAPLGDQALVFNGVNLVGPNLITVADNGTIGSYPAGQAVNSNAPVEPYPGVTPGFTYVPATPADGSYTVTNTIAAFGVPGSPVWATSDHTTALETGRFMFVNGANPGAVIFTQTVSVTPNTDYFFSAWPMNAISRQTGFQLPQMGLQVLDAGGNVIVSQSVNPLVPQSVPTWVQNGFVFDSGANSSLTVQLVSLGAAATGNDYHIDDVTMFQVQFVDLLALTKSFNPPIAYTQDGTGATSTVTVNVTNTTAQPQTNVSFQDVLAPNLQFVPGTLTVNGNPTAFDPNVEFSLGTLAANATAVVQFQVKALSGPSVTPNTAKASYDAITSPNGDVIRNTVSSNTATFEVVVNKATVEMTKTADKTFVDANGIITYTLTLQNSGNVAANNVVITDPVPNGTTFVPGSVTGATGTPPTLTVASIPAGGNATVTFQVQVGNTVPNPNPVPNAASVNYTFTVDPAQPNGASGTAQSNTVTTQANMALVTTNKAVNATYAEIGQVLTYTLTVQNTGNVAANNVVITDPVPNGTTFVPGSVTGATGTPPTLTVASVAANSTATVTFQVQVGQNFPVPNPIPNAAGVAFQYTVDPAQPNGASGTAPSNTVTTQVNDANITTVLAVDKAVTDVGTVLTYTVTLTNTGNVPADNVTLNAPTPAGTTFINGSLSGATGTPPTLSIPGSIPAGGSKTVTYQVLVGDTIPNPNPIPQTVTTNFTFTLDPANPDGQPGTSTSNTVNTLVNSAIITTVKTADKAFADVGDIITYTITVNNSGNVPANNVVLTDALPAGVTFVAGSLTNATGTPPTLTLSAPVPAGGSVAVTYQVKVSTAVPNPNPVDNSASAAFTYTVNPENPNGASGTSFSNTAATEINTAKLVMQKSADKMISYIGNIITYQIAVQNTGNVNADNVVLTDLLPTGLSEVAGSLVVSVPFSGTLASGLALTNPIAAGGLVTISFKAKVDAIPNPNPALNHVTAAYSYVVIPGTEGVPATAASNTVSTVVFRNNFGQQISDLIESVALEQAALAAIANAEGAKIQRMAALSNVTPQQLLCLNKSVAEMMDSIALLEAVLKQKLSVVDCQIDGTIVC